MTRQQLAISMGQHSSAGAKAENQDFHGAWVPDGADLATKGIAIAIADGISTSRRGAEAAEIAVKSFLTDYYCTSEGWSARKSGECVIGATNSWMHAENARSRPREEGHDREAAGLICTLTALVLKGGAAHLFHIGDCRVLHVRGEDSKVLTTPHRIQLGGGESYLGRALGVNRHVEVEYARVQLQEGDIFLLTSDGVHEFLSDDDPHLALLATVGLDEAAAYLAHKAQERGSSDNLTVQLLRVEQLPAGEVSDVVGADWLLSPPPELRVGQLFEGYEILQQIHSGSRSHAYLASDPVDGSAVVIKVPATDQVQDRSALAGLLLEEWVMQRLSHPGLLAAAPQHAPRQHAYSVSRYVAGRSLHQWMLEQGRAELPQARRILGQISAALEAMHRREMLHRDLRPHNVMIDDKGHVTIIDFGSTQVAGLDEAVPRAFEDGAFAGTIQYSAPELYLGYPASRESDVFSLGVIAYQMLTGELPYGTSVAAADTPAAQRRLRYVPATAHNPDIPEWVDAALARAVAVDPRQRYAEPAEFVSDLARPGEHFLSGQHKPLLQRGSVRSWRIIAALLAAALVVSVITRPDFMPSRPPTEKEELEQ